MTRLEARLRYRWQSSASTYSIEIWIIDQWEYEIISNGHRGIGHLDRPVCLGVWTTNLSTYSVRSSGMSPVHIYNIRYLNKTAYVNIPQTAGLSRS